MFFYENFFNIAKVPWENSKPFWRYQNFSSREEDVHVLSPIYGRSVKWRKTINEMGGNIPGVNFLGGNFPGEIFQGWVWWVGIFRVGIFLESHKGNSFFLIPTLILITTPSFPNISKSPIYDTVRQKTFIVRQNSLANEALFQSLF